MFTLRAAEQRGASVSVRSKGERCVRTYERPRRRAQLPRLPPPPRPRTLPHPPSPSRRSPWGTARSHQSTTVSPTWYWGRGGQTSAIRGPGGAPGHRQRAGGAQGGGLPARHAGGALRSTIHPPPTLWLCSSPRVAPSPATSRQATSSCAARAPAMATALVLAGVHAAGRGARKCVGSRLLALCAAHPDRPAACQCSGRVGGGRGCLLQRGVRLCRCSERAHKTEAWGCLHPIRLRQGQQQLSRGG